MKLVNSFEYSCQRARTETQKVIINRRICGELIKFSDEIVKAAD
jgi:hypothetical protein